MNLTKAALYRSTILSTVSPTYAREIQTPAFTATAWTACSSGAAAIWSAS